MATTDELQAEVDQLKTQQALTVQAVKAFLEGRLNGPDSATWLLAAISPNEPAPVPADFAIGE